MKTSPKRAPRGDCGAGAPPAKAGMQSERLPYGLAQAL